MDVGCDQWTKAAVRICRRKNSTSGLRFTIRDVLDRGLDICSVADVRVVGECVKVRAGTRCG